MLRAAMPVLLFLSQLAVSGADPWKGKEASAVLELLGPPQKQSTSKAGDESWVYRFVRVVEGDLADPSLTLLEVPGVGLVGRRPEDGGGSAPTVSVEPTVLDEQGHPTGGLTTTESRSMSWSKDKGKVVSGEPPPGSSSRKIKLTFRLDATGRVVDWDVQPKPAGARSG